MIKKLTVLMFLASIAHSATYYISLTGNDTTGDGSTGTPWATFTKAFGAGGMSGGDTLIVRNGTYTEETSAIPSGTAESYTNIEAENNWGVTIVGGLGISSKEYIRIEGIHFDANGSGSAGGALSSDHLKFIRCSFSNAGVEDWNIQAFSLSGCSYVTVEECFAWGTGRYKFLAYQSDHIIFRRCVARHDYHPSTQCATFTRYDSANVEFQNCISVDGGIEGVETGGFEQYGGIWNENNANVDTTGKDLGCIFLNLRANAVTDYKIIGTRNIENCIAWDCKGGMQCGGIVGLGANFTANHCTSGDSDGEAQDTSRVWGVGFQFGNSTGTHTVLNSIAINNNTLGIAGGYTVSNYNALYGNLGNGSYVNNAGGGTVDHGTSGYEVADAAIKGNHDLCAANSNAIDPLDGNPGNSVAALKYLPRIETGSNLKGAASDSGDIGATVLKRYGVAETLWGEPGYETLANENLWPFPNENVIKEKMKAYSVTHTYNGGGTVSGNRGFCADGKQLNGVSDITLTSYIWEYLGNEMPAEIYGKSEPARRRLSISGGVTITGGVQLK